MAQTSISGRLFENSLRKMVSTIVWHNKYLGDKHDMEDAYVDAVEVDTYLTGARHLLMTYTKTELENVEDMTETEYFSFRQREFVKEEVNKLMPYWDMFYFGTKFDYDVDNTRAYSDGNGYFKIVDNTQFIDSNNNLIYRRYEEKNDYYRELYGLPAYAGTTCHCPRCDFVGNFDGNCPKCGEYRYRIDTRYSAPSMYAYAAKFPKNIDMPANDTWNNNDIYTDPVTGYVYNEQDEYGSRVKSKPAAGETYTDVIEDGKQLVLKYNPLVFLYSQPLQLRIYAEFSTTFVSELIEKTKHDRHYTYLKHMTYSKIHPFVARISDRFEILYMEQAEIDALTKDFANVYEECRLYMKYRYYTEAFRNQYTEYEGFIGLAILFMALQRMQAKYLETDITRDFYDLESIEVVYNAYSVPFYEDIPVLYHTRIIKAINILLSKKGTNECFKDIFNIFGYSTLNIYQYYILKTQKQDSHGVPMYYYDKNGNEVPEKMYDVKIVKADIGENPYSYIIDSLNYMSYRGVTDPDTYWLNDDDLLYKLYHSEYNFLETKYIGIEMVFSLTRFTIETEYIMRMLLDNKDSGGNGTDKLTIHHGNLGIDLDLYTLVLYIMYIIGKEFGLANGGSLTPLTDPIKLASVYGFNFIEDLSMVYGYLSRQFVFNYKPGYMQKRGDYYYFVPTNYAGITADTITERTLPLLLSEAELNKLDVDNDSYAGFIKYIENYINNGYIKPVVFINYVYAANEDIPNLPKPDALKVLAKLVIGFNNTRKLLTTYTDEESKMKNLLDFKFVKVYYSDNVCAYCGLPRVDFANMYAYCHNTACYSNHAYEDGNGPLLKDMKGRIPKKKEIDTSKDTELKIYRNQVYAEFVSNFELFNPLILNIIQIFDTYPRDMMDTTEYINYRLQVPHEDTNILLISDDIDMVNPGNPVTITIYDGITVLDTIEATVVDKMASTVDIEVSPGEIVTYHQIIINKNVSCNVNDQVSIKYRNVVITYDTWCQMMEAGLEERINYIKAKEKYEYMLKIYEVDPSKYTPEEIEAQRQIMLTHLDNYTHSLYYLIGIITEFINMDYDIDLYSSDYIWDGTNTIGYLLETHALYDPLVRLRTKREFRLLLSGQIDELTPIALDQTNYYHDRIDDIRWLNLYLKYYFLDRESKKTKSVLVDTMDKFFLYDQSKFMGQSAFNHVEDNPAVDVPRNAVAYSYMNDTLAQKFDPITNAPINVFDYVQAHIRNIIDADRTMSDVNDYELNIGIGRAVDKDWNKLQSSYNAIVELHNEFTNLTWGIKNPDAFYAVRRLNKMLMTTYYANKIYTRPTDKKVATSYKDLLDSINPLLALRIDNMTDKQRIIELEYSLSYLDKISDDLIYIHSYGGFNMKKILSYIWKLIYFFKSAKVDLLDYALEFRVDDKTDNLMKYMTELTKLTTNSTVTPDQWKLSDVAASHDMLTRLNIDKSIKLVFTDVVMNIGSYIKKHSANYLMDQIRSHTSSVVNATDLNYTVYDYMMKDFNITYIGKSGHWDITDIDPTTSQKSYNVSDKDISEINHIRNSGVSYNPTISRNEAYDIEKITQSDVLQLVKRVVYELDTSVVPTYDDHGNPIYPYIVDEHGNRVPTVFDTEDEYRDFLYADNKRKWHQYFDNIID